MERDTPGMPADWPLVGRREELRTLSGVLSKRKPQSVILVGPAGVGKTRLARECVELAEAAGHCVVWIIGTPSASRAPLGALVPLLPVAGSTPGTDNLADLLRHSARALLERAGDRRLVLFVDDAHVLDDASAGLIHQLVANDSASILATVRSGEPAPPALTELWKSDYATRVHLQVLPPAALEDLLGSVLGGQIDPAMTADFVARSQGNVFFFRELVLGALSDDALRREDGLWRLVSPPRPSERIIELVEARLEGLDPQARTLLELVSYGEPLGGAELSALGDASRADMLEREGLLASSFDRRRLQVRLGHPLYGEVLRGRTPAIRVREIARTLAETTEATGARRREDALRVGVWRLDGGGGRAQVMLAAASDARWHYDFELAGRLARAAGEVGGGFDAALLAAQVLALQGRPREAEAELAILRDLAADDAERTRLAVARLDCLWLYLGDMDAAQRVAEEAEAAISDAGLRDEVTARRVAALLGTQGPRAAMELAARLLPRAEGRLMAWLGVAASFSLSRLGRIQEAIDAADRGYAASGALAEPTEWYPAFSIYGRCEALVHSGRFREADQLARQQYRHELEVGCSETRAWFLWHMARTVHDCGRVDTATRQAREALTLIRQLSRPPVEHSILSVLALAFALGGHHDDARRTLAAIERLDIDPPMWTGADLLLARGWTAVATGRLGEARELLGEAAAFGEKVGDLMGAAAALHDIARLGEPTRVLAGLTDLAAQLEGKLTVARVAHVGALARRSPSALVAAADAFEEMGADLLAAEAAADAAVAYRRTHQRRQATAAEHRAAILAGRCEAVTPSLRSIDTRARLTPAEHRAAVLAARGKSNKEIAEELVLSVRTVENRLYRVYGKLGVTRRSNLAEALREPVSSPSAITDAER